ncbi:hypothetical protein MMC10_000671 [Thelotrema lepadinum]|nr:hypothetical protein [Thelotrema lepadinum]
MSIPSIASRYSKYIELVFQANNAIQQTHFEYSSQANPFHLPLTPPQIPLLTLTGDTSTTPTTSMLSSLTYTTLLDDVLHADPTTNRLETSLASLLSHPAATLVSSGTMGNQLATRVHLSTPSPHTNLAGPPHSLLADARSHILSYEAGAVASLSGALPIGVNPETETSGGRQHLTLEDIKRHAVISDDEHFAPTALVCLENTIHGAIIPLSECRAITDWCRERGIRTHLDGARLWEAVAAQVAEGHYSGSLEDGMRAYGRCFDSVTVCFSKGLGAPIGSMLVGSEGFIKRARHVRKSWGGGMRQTGLIAAPAEVAVKETFFGGQLVRGHEVARRIGKMWTEKGGRLVRGVETNMVWIDLGAWEGMSGVWETETEREGLRVYGGTRGRVVVHYQVCEEAVGKLGVVFGRVLDRGFAERWVEEKKREGMEGEGDGFKGYGGEGKKENGVKSKRKVEDAALDGDEGVAREK